MKQLRNLWDEEGGQDIAEYAVMLAVILVLVVGTGRHGSADWVKRQHCVFQCGEFDSIGQNSAHLTFSGIRKPHLCASNSARIRSSTSSTRSRGFGFARNSWPQQLHLDEMSRCSMSMLSK
jgi:Flp pilus assembly pilin Flp